MKKMKLNRNNYEEYFLLYADNELTADEKYQVELFIEANNDLKAEFIAIQQTINEPEEIIIDKNFLLKKIGKQITTNDLLMLLDNELSESEKHEIINGIADNKSLVEEYNNFKKVTFLPDLSVSFPDKELLYKKTERAKIIYFYRVAAAAVLITFGLWGGYQLVRNNEEIPKKEIAKTVTGSPATKSNSNTSDTIQKIEKDNKQADIAVIKMQPVSENNVAANPVVKVITPVKKEETQPVKTNDLPQRELAYQQPDKIKGNDVDHNIGTENGVIPNASIDEHALNVNTGADYNTQPAQQESIVHPTSYSPNESSGNYAFYNVPQEQFRKTKIAGFLKTAKRMITRNLPGGARTD
ncbi:hypothetical protein BH09BAC2_BH09BAC2_02440 [soil metagenome]